MKQPKRIKLPSGKFVRLPEIHKGSFCMLYSHKADTYELSNFSDYNPIIYLCYDCLKFILDALDPEVEIFHCATCDSMILEPEPKTGEPYYCLLHNDASLIIRGERSKYGPN